MRERMCFPYKDDMKDLREYTDDVEMIHNKMMDDLSEMIFSNRLLFSLTGNHKYMKYISLQTIGGKNLYHTFLDDDHSKYIYGAGIRGRRLIELFPEHKWDGFIDKNVAEWFARRFGHNGDKCYIFTGIINKKDILALFNSRNEKEVVCDYRKIKNIQCEEIIITDNPESQFDKHIEICITGE